MSSEFYEVPAKQFRWNWGAFSDPVSFGFANRTWKVALAFLPCLIPCLMALLWAYNIVPHLIPLASIPLLFSWNVSCGLFAERWVWATGQFEDGATFRAVMDSWNRAGMLRAIIAALSILLTIAVIAALAAGLIGGVNTLVENLFPIVP